MEKPPIERPKPQPSFAPLRKTMEHNALLKLKKQMDPEAFEHLANMTLEDQIERKSFVEKQLLVLEEAIKQGDEKLIESTLGILGGVIHSLTPVPAGSKIGEIPGVESDRGSYKLLLGTGTRGQRIWLKSQDEHLRDFLTFEADKPEYSADLQAGFKNVFGERAKTLGDEDEPTVFVSIPETSQAPCPCRSGRPYSECHGA